MIGEIEKYSCYEFEIFEYPDDDYPDTKYYYYKIYTSDIDYINWMKTNILRESEECFDTEQQARFAAVGHIDLLENGED